MLDDRLFSNESLTRMKRKLLEDGRIFKIVNQQEFNFEEGLKPNEAKYETREDKR